MELQRLEVSARVVELVREHQYLTARRAQDLGELLVARRHTRRRVDHEKDEIGLLDGLARLCRDLRHERPGVGLVDAAGVDEAERRPRPLAQELLAVARDSRRLVDDSRARRGQAIDQRRLADVRKPDDRDRAREFADFVDDLARSALVTPPGAHVGGVASRGRPSSWTPASQSHSFLISRSISADASL